MASAPAATMEEAGYRVVFEKGGVYLHTSARGRHQDPGSLIAGVLRLLEKDNDVILHWAPVEEAGDSSHVVFSRKEPSGGDPCPSEEEPTFDPGYEPDWAVISTVRSRPRPPEPDPAAGSGSSRGPWAFSVSLGELKSIRRSKPGLGWAYLVLVTQAGGSLPALHFHRGGTRALLRVLSRYLLLASSPQDPRLYLVFPHDSSALSHSFHHLQLFDDDSSNVVSVSLWSEGWRAPGPGRDREEGRAFPGVGREVVCIEGSGREAHHHLPSFILSSAFSPGSLCSYLWWFLTGDQLFSRSPSASP